MGPVSTTLVTGASGNVGGELVRQLASGGRDVRALSRRAQADGLPAGVTQVAADLNDPASLAGALAGVDRVFLLPGYRDMPGLVTQLEASGVELVVLLSSRAAARPDPANAITSMMTDSEQAIQASGLRWTILRASGFMSNAAQWAPQLRAGDVVTAPFPAVAIASIDPQDIAAVAAAVLADNQHAGACYAISGPQPLTPADQVAVLGPALGRRLTFRPEPDEAARARMLSAMPARYVDAMFRYYADGSFDDSAVDDTVPALLGRPARTFGQWAQEHAALFS
jgi:uncharacterized protein YbjT (DUF2867 family)